jgi:hypothetical protein
MSQYRTCVDWNFPTSRVMIQACLLVRQHRYLVSCAVGDDIYSPEFVWVIDDRPAAQPAAARENINGMTITIIIQGETLTLIKCQVVRLLVTVSGMSFLHCSLSLPSQTA